MHGKRLLKIIFKYYSQNESMEIASEEHFLCGLTLNK